MEWYYVIADDITGANAAGVLLKKEGLNPYTIIKGRKTILKNVENGDAVICSTESRNLTGSEAYELVKSYMELLKNKNPGVITKRIDSTMRGNIGAEIDAVLDSLGQEYIAVVVPTFPSAGRTVKNGILYVHGIFLENTETADDPRMPVKCSDVKKIIQMQSKYAAVNVELSSLSAPEVLIQKIRQETAAGNRILIFDAETDGDLKLIAEALTSQNIKYVSVDPGPFTAHLARIKQRKQKKNEKILLLIGSVNPVTHKQFIQFWKGYGKESTVFLETGRLLESDADRKKEICNTVNKCLEIFRQGKIAAVIGDGIYPEKRFDLLKNHSKYESNINEISATINNTFAEIAEGVLKSEKKVSKLFLSGGDIVVAVFGRLGVETFTPVSEVLPLAVYGKVSGGKMTGKSVLTKGGMAGNESAIVDCIRYLERER